ncbi:MAG: hypothetical protein KIT56_09685 [Gammaproteobacteria bacterium]|nr:hypothetical protein [Gammaproteobacteria bacterium]MCW5584122.1 hypothetical protein [Gammaproteobacteria bacterium]
MHRQQQNDRIPTHSTVLKHIEPIKKIEDIRKLFNFSHHLIWIEAADNKNNVNQLISHVVAPQNEARKFLRSMYILSGHAMIGVDKLPFSIVESRNNPGLYRVIIYLDRVNETMLINIKRNKTVCLKKVVEFLNAFNWPDRKLGEWTLDTEDKIIFTKKITDHGQDHPVDEELNSQLLNKISKYCLRKNLSFREITDGIDVSTFSKMLAHNINHINKHKSYELLLSPTLMLIIHKIILEKNNRDKKKREQDDDSMQPMEVCLPALSRHYQELVGSTISFYFDDIISTLLSDKKLNECNESELLSVRRVLKKCLNHKAELREDAVAIEILPSVKTLRDILNHPYPQNKAVGNGSAFDAQVLKGKRDKLTVEEREALRSGIYRNQAYYYSNGFGSSVKLEPVGIFNLTGYSDKSELNREMVVIYIRNQLRERYNDVQAALQQLKKLKDEENNMAAKTISTMAAPTITTVGATTSSTTAAGLFQHNAIHAVVPSISQQTTGNGDKNHITNQSNSSNSRT